MSVEHTGWIAAGILGLLALLQTARLGLDRRARARRIQRARRRAEQAERAAERLLERAGYRIEAIQPILDWVVYCDDQPRTVELRADLVVSRRGRRYVVEVKTGAVAPSLSTAATRRQLLEYRVAYDADGVLLVNMEAEQIHEVSFGLGRRRASSGSRSFAWVGALALVAIALWWLVAWAG